MKYILHFESCINHAYLLKFDIEYECIHAQYILMIVIFLHLERKREKETYKNYTDLKFSY